MHKFAMTTLLTAGVFGYVCGAAAAADAIKGQVLGGGQPIANSMVTLWAADAGAPTELGQARSGADGSFSLNSAAADKDAILYLIAKGGQPKASAQTGDNPAIALMTVIGGNAPTTVTINEMTTIASVWTHNQFISGTAIKGSPLSLRIAAGNVPNFVDLATGSYGVTIADGVNSTQTPTLANFATLANVLSGCVTLVTANACDKLFIATTPPAGSAPTDTLAAAEAIARFPAYQPEKVFALLESFYPIPQGKAPLRPTPFVPYLSFAPSAWVLPLKFTGGGLNAGGKLMFDSQGNAWVVDNFAVGAQNQDPFWRGNLSKFTPNGKPLSPAVTGFTGGGMLGPGFGLAIDAHDNPWVTSFAGNNTVSHFDNSGKPLSPPEGYNFGGKLSKMQGIIVTPSGDVWAADTLKSQLAYFPKGDPSKGELLCQNPSGDPLRNPCKLVLPFALAVDQQNNIWVSNILADHVTRFPGGDTTKPETLKAGFSGSGLAVDSVGNVWITNKFGNSERGRVKILEMAAAAKVNYNGDPDSAARLTTVLVNAMVEQKPGWEGGSLTVLRPDGTEAKFSPIYGKGIFGPWAVSVDGNDHIWVSNFTSAEAGIVELCGVRPETCPAGMKTGDAISPPGGYVGGGLQLQVDVGIGPAGDVWVTNNWQDHTVCYYGKPKEVFSTLCAGQGVVVFFGMAKPVRAPLIGPARQP